MREKESGGRAVRLGRGFSRAGGAGPRQPEFEHRSTAAPPGLDACFRAAETALRVDSGRPARRIPGSRNRGWVLRGDGGGDGPLKSRASDRGTGSTGGVRVVGPRGSVRAGAGPALAL
nr:hypothetical protein GCM10017745_28050 [Saccharothrix mutabilis subsp. capreolus]